MAQKDELREIEDMGNAFVDTHARVGKDIATKLPKLFDTLHDPTADECTRSNALKEIEDCIEQMIKLMERGEEYTNALSKHVGFLAAYDNVCDLTTHLKDGETLVTGNKMIDDARLPKMKSFSEHLAGMRRFKEQHTNLVANLKKSLDEARGRIKNEAGRGETKAETSAFVEELSEGMSKTTIGEEEVD